MTENTNQGDFQALSLPVSLVTTSVPAYDNYQYGDRSENIVTLLKPSTFPGTMTVENLGPNTDGKDVIRLVVPTGDANLRDFLRVVRDTIAEEGNLSSGFFLNTEAPGGQLGVAPYAQLLLVQDITESLSTTSLIFAISNLGIPNTFGPEPAPAINTLTEGQPWTVIYHNSYPEAAESRTYNFVPMPPENVSWPIVMHYQHNEAGELLYVKPTYLYGLPYQPKGEITLKPKY